MKRALPFLAALLFFPILAPAQTTDPVKVEALHQRFQSGLDLIQQGQPEDALAVFTGILKDEPKAPGSLYFAGFINLQLGHPEKALDYLNALYAINPNDYKPLVLLIQANQELHRSIRVEEYRKQLLAIRNAGTEVHGLTDAKAYPRERVYLDNKGGEIEFNEFFDYKTEPFIAYEAMQRDASGTLIRHILATYNPDQTAELRKKDPKLETVEVFLFGEFVIKDKEIKQFNLYRQETEMPTYDKFHQWVLDAIKEPPKPIYVQPTT